MFSIRIYSEEDKEKLFLTPYCIIRCETDRTCIYQTLFDQTLTLTIDGDVACEFIKLLKNGCFEYEIADHLCGLISREQADALIKQCIKAGIIE